jgi:hypothetical protein
MEGRGGLSREVMVMSEDKLADKLLELAGLAAEELERKGYVSVARMRDGVVTLEWWKVVGARQYHMRRVIKEASMTADELADSCDAEFHASISAYGSS